VGRPPAEFVQEIQGRSRAARERTIGAFVMKKMLPSRTELAILGCLAVLCTGIIGINKIPQDLMLPLLSIPVFVIAAVMGLRRSPQWAEPAADEDDSLIS
jgi:hypothetical protein